MGNIFIRFSMKKIIFCFMADMENRKKNVPRPGYIKISGAVLFFVLILGTASEIYMPHPPELVTVRKFNGPETLNNFFPDFARLSPQKRFWKNVFTEYTTSQVLIHDEWYLDLVYEVIDLGRLGKKPWEKVKKEYEKYRLILKNIAENPGELSGQALEIYEKLSRIKENSLFPLKDAYKRVHLQMGHADSIKKGIIKSGRYLKNIKKILKENNLPKELAYLPMIESAFNPYSNSYLGASGLWQLMRRTAKQYGLRMDHIVDERRDPALSTEVAAKHLAHNYEVLKSWPLAITAYNHGLQGMVNAIKKTGSKNLADIIEKYDGPRFEFASRNFYMEFITMLEIIQNSFAYFGLLNIEDPVDTAEFEVEDYVDLKTIAEYAKIDMAEIKRLNPALLSAAYKPGNPIPKGYKLKLCPENIEKLEFAYVLIPDNLKYARSPFEGQHIVRKGQTLSEIAKIHKISAKNLARFNGIRNPRRIRAGQRLKIPGKYVALTDESKSRNNSSKNRQLCLRSDGRH